MADLYGLKENKTSGVLFSNCVRDKTFNLIKQQTAKTTAQSSRFVINSSSEQKEQQYSKCKHCINSPLRNAAPFSYSHPKSEEERSTPMDNIVRLRQLSTGALFSYLQIDYITE